MIQINKEFLLILLNLINAASKDETRLYLNGVNIRKHNHKNLIVMEASDGKILAQHRIQNEELYQHLQESVIVSTESILTLKTFMQTWKSVHWFYMRIEEDYLAVSVSQEFSLLSSIPLRLIKRDYPDLDSITRTPKPTMTVTLNPELLIAVHKAMQGIIKRKATSITLEIVNELAPIKVYCSDLDPSSGLIMPIKTPQK